MVTMKVGYGRKHITVENFSPDVQPECVVAVLSMPEKRWQLHEHGFTCR
jgi:hypothetical protein